MWRLTSLPLYEMLKTVHTVSLGTHLDLFASNRPTIFIVRWF